MLIINAIKQDFKVYSSGNSLQPDQLTGLFMSDPASQL